MCSHTQLELIFFKINKYVFGHIYLFTTDCMIIDPSTSNTLGHTNYKLFEGKLLFHCKTCNDHFITHRSWIKHLKCENKCANLKNSKQTDLDDSLSVVVKSESVTTQLTSSSKPITRNSRPVFKPKYRDNSQSLLVNSLDFVLTCPMPDCIYETRSYPAYHDHRRRYHSPNHPDGIWYMCHLCPQFKVRKSSTMSNHLKSVHRFQPNKSTKRHCFFYKFNPDLHVYELKDRPEAPKFNKNSRLLLPKT